MSEEFGGEQGGNEQGAQQQQGQQGPPAGSTPQQQADWRANNEYRSHFTNEYHQRLFQKDDPEVKKYVQSLMQYHGIVSPEDMAIIERMRTMRQQRQAPQGQPQAQQRQQFDINALPKDIRETLDWAAQQRNSHLSEQNQRVISDAASGLVEKMGYTSAKAQTLAQTLVEQGLADPRNAQRSPDEIASMVKAVIDEAIGEGVSAKTSATEQAKNRFQTLTGGQSFAQFSEKKKTWSKDDLKNVLLAGAEAREAQG